ncbi:MAG: Fe-S cluster protein [Phycisphaerae bacterium]|nr:Fe-S cluster protein [Phycisphaerae bacterium]
MKFSYNSPETVVKQLPGLNCGLCGAKTCEQFAHTVFKNPHELDKCIHLKSSPWRVAEPVVESSIAACAACSACEPVSSSVATTPSWKDSLGRDFDFMLDSFPQEPGPRETILPHNPARIKELDVKVGDVLIGRPMGMSCGCPITHCGIAMQVDPVNGVVVWCVTGPLRPRSGERKDIGYYSAQAYEGIVTATRSELKIGMRYWFMPHRCMLQWRHSGLVNFINKRGDNAQIRVEGLLIG